MYGRDGWLKGLALALVLLTLLALLASGGVAEGGGQAENITKRCTFKLSEGDKGKLTDDSVRSTWEYENPDAYVAVRLPEGVEAGWLRVEWFYDPTGYELVEYDSSMNELQRRDQSCTFPNIYSVYELLPQTRTIQLRMTAMDQQISRLVVYSAGKLPDSVQVWNPPVEKADVMVLSTHQDDELIFLGGTIPYYATALKKPTVVVYMANCNRSRRKEALNALWKMGVRDYPDFINLKDDKVSSINAGIKLWGGRDNILSLLAERIRRYKPEVIVTQDLNGEYGHNQHKIVAQAAMYAIEAAADPTQYTDSVEKYGEWQVKKLYHHLYKKNQIEMDWETPLDSLNGYTPLKVAQIGMEEHASQLQYYAVKSHGTYDNSKFGLYFTTVGEDVEKNDFLEHIDPDASAKYLEEHADEIAAREAAAEATPTPEPTEGPVAEDIPVEAEAGEDALETTDAEAGAAGTTGATGTAGAARWLRVSGWRLRRSGKAFPLRSPSETANTPSTSLMKARARRTSNRSVLKAEGP